MFITCSECGTKYQLPPDALGGAGRDVRCTKCGHVWFQEPIVAPESVGFKDSDVPESLVSILTGEIDSGEEAEAIPRVATEPTPGPTPEPSVTIDTPAPKSRRVIDTSFLPEGAGVAAAVFAVLMMISAITLLVFQQPLVRAWPPIAALYQSVGLKLSVPGQGIEIRNLLAEQSKAQDDVLFVTATLVNMSPRAVDYPSVKVSLQAADGSILKDWRFRANSGRFEPGVAEPVNLQLIEAPLGGSKLILRLSDGGKS